MTESELYALLDAHDALVRACVEGRLPFAEFALAYGDFPHGYGLDGHKESKEWQGMIERSRARVAFHREVAAVLSGMARSNDLQIGVAGDAGGFIEKAVYLRLRQLVERYPDCRLIGAETASDALEQ